VAELGSVGVSLIQAEQHIPHDIGVGVLVYGNPRRRMRAINHAQAVLYAAFCECLINTFGYIGKSLSFGAEFEFIKHNNEPRLMNSRARYFHRALHFCY